MPLHYIHAEQLGALYPALRQNIKTERAALEPQTPQTIIVGNLDTEAWLTRRFLADDGILMGISYPFLESAIRSFSERLILQVRPTGSESWFMPPQQGTDRPPAIGLAELEIILLGLIADKKNAALLADLGYPPDELTQARSTALAARLAEELRESILHIPQVLEKLVTTKAADKRPAAQLWRQVHAALAATGRPFPSLDPTLPARILAVENSGIAANHGLHLFGMPLLSQYHIRTLVAMARHLPVWLYMTDLSVFAAGENALLASAGQNAAEFRNLLRHTCDEFGVPFGSHQVATPKATGRRLEVHAYPGAWRAAELLGDDFHASLMANPEMRQDDFAVALTDAQAQYAAFERACGMRQMSAFSRTRFYEAPPALADLWQILGEAAHSGPNRALIARFAANLIVVQANGGDREKISLWLEVLEKANGYRDDYPDQQESFNIRAARHRLLRGVITGSASPAENHLPAAKFLRPFDSFAFSEAFQRFLTPLLAARSALAEKQGSELADAMLKLQHEITPPGAEITLLARWLENLRPVAGFETLALAQVIRLLVRHLPATGLVQQTAREGVTFAPLHATCFVKKTQIIFDLSEDTDRRDESAETLFTELKQAPTRLRAREQLALHLATALAGEAERLIFARTGLDPASGAEKYPSQLLAYAESAAALCGRTTAVAAGFAPTLLSAPEKNPPIAADADRQTAWLLQRGTPGKAPQLSALLLPATPPAAAAQNLDLKDLRSFLSNPARYRLQRYLPPEIEMPAFRREEPRLAVSSSARLAFCEDYLKTAVLSAASPTLCTALDYVTERQLRGEAPPQGFDHATELLKQNNNDVLLTTLARSAQHDLELVEYCFRTGINEPFAVRDAERLTRYYLPAPEIGGLSIAGSSGPLMRLKSSGEIFLWQSAIYAQRNADLIWCHLLLAVLAACKTQLPNGQIRLADFNTKTTSKEAIASLKFSPRDAMQQPTVTEAQQYLTLLVSELGGESIVWYDHALLKKENLAKWAERPDEELLENFPESDADGQDEKILMLQRYFALEAGEKTIAFFNNFIRPVARIDKELNAKENKKAAPEKKTKGGKNGKS